MLRAATRTQARKRVSEGGCEQDDAKVAAATTTSTTTVRRRRSVYSSVGTTATDIRRSCYAQVYRWRFSPSALPAATSNLRSRIVPKTLTKTLDHRRERIILLRDWHDYHTGHTIYDIYKLYNSFIYIYEASIIYLLYILIDNKILYILIDNKILIDDKIILIDNDGDKKNF